MFRYPGEKLKKHNWTAAYQHLATAFMNFHKIIMISVGADLSCTSPIYRPPANHHDIPM